MAGAEGVLFWCGRDVGGGEGKGRGGEEEGKRREGGGKLGGNMECRNQPHLAKKNP